MPLLGKIIIVNLMALTFWQLARQFTDLAFANMTFGFVAGGLSVYLLMRDLYEGSKRK